MKEFDFDKFWADSVNYASLDNNAIRIKTLLPLYEKMREWGFEWIEIDWFNQVVIVGDTPHNCFKEKVKVEKFLFGDISDFPRALKEAFKWMWEHRKKQPIGKCRWCGKDVYSDNCHIYNMSEVAITESSVAHSQCHKDRPKLKCDHNGPCDKLCKCITCSATDYCGYCGIYIKDFNWM